ncbi:hypothetical protein PROP_02827 [Propionicimonas sp. T2.31MG-18]|uniref:hypothetical protein n=1 Tax=Propionicimonas sp. T2.31MG-18 TaxID=3157620 RepID=UPI0035ED7BDD
MRATVWVAPVASVVILFGSVGIAQATGGWTTSGRTVVQADLTAEDVKGWMTIQQAADGLGVPVAAIIDLIDPPEGVVLEPGTALRDVEAVVDGFSLATLREKLRTLAR